MLRNKKLSRGEPRTVMSIFRGYITGNLSPVDGVISRKYVAVSLFFLEPLPSCEKPSIEDDGSSCVSAHSCYKIYYSTTFA